jgi:hypothetical protein
VPGWFRIRPAVLGAVVWCSIVFAAAGFASNLKDVRVGPHGEYTRVVLETDAKVSYSLNQSADVVTIELQASATPKAVTAKSQQLSWVRVEPAGASSLVRIELKGPARVKQMVLSGPNRIVLDVYGDVASATQAAARPEPAPVVAEPAPVAALPPGIAETAATGPRADDEAALIQREADALLGPEPGAVPGDELAATEGLPSDDSRVGDGEIAAAEAPAPEAKPALPPRLQATKAKKGVLDWLLDPYILLGLAVVMAGLFFILRRQRPAPQAVAAPPRDESESASSLFAPASDSAADTETIATDESERVGSFEVSGEARDESAAAPRTAPADEGGSPFEFEAPDVDPEKPEVGRAHGATLSTIGAVTSTAAYETKAPTATGGLSMAELDRRLALLEQRLEEVIDAKDRLERQVSAQTEELRVQRAAIARTQRVLRTVVRPEDDQPSEPVLKS